MYEHVLAFIATLLFHALIALALLLNLDWQQQPVVVEATQYEVVDAVAIDESKLLAKLGSSKAVEFKETFQHQWEQQQRLAAIRYEKLKQEEQRLEKIRLEKERAKELARLAKLEQERKRLEKQRKQEQQRLAKLRQKQAELKRQAEKKKAEKERREREKKAAQRKAAEKERKEKERKAQIARVAKQERERQQQLEKQRQQEQQRKEAARKAKIEQEKQAARQRQAAKEAELQRQIAAKRKAIQDQRIARVINAIRGKVLQHWQRPANTSTNLSSRILVKLTTKGAVIQAQLTVSSGHTAFDSSAIRAVYKASPLPIPKDLYSHFKSFTFTFRPPQ